MGEGHRAPLGLEAVCITVRAWLRAVHVGIGSQAVCLKCVSFAQYKVKAKQVLFSGKPFPKTRTNAPP